MMLKESRTLIIVQSMTAVPGGQRWSSYKQRVTNNYFIILTKSFEGSLKCLAFRILTKGQYSGNLYYGRSDNLVEHY